MHICEWNLCLTENLLGGNEKWGAKVYKYQFLIKMSQISHTYKSNNFNFKSLIILEVFRSTTRQI